MMKEWEVRVLATIIIMAFLGAIRYVFDFETSVLAAFALVIYDLIYLEGK